MPKLIKYSSPHAINLEKRRKKQESIRKQYDKTAKNLPPVSIGDKIYFQSPEGKDWSRGEIIKKIGSRTYIIRVANGRTYKKTGFTYEQFWD